MKKTKSRGRPNREELRKRIDRAEELLISESSSTRVVEALASEFDVQERSAWRWVAHARKRWDDEAESEGSRESKRNHYRRVLQFVQTKAYQEGDYKAALGAIKQLRELDGLDVPKELRLSAGFDGGGRNEFEDRSPADLVIFLRTGRMPLEGSGSGENADS